MQYKDILVYLDNGASNASRVELALALASAHQAQVTGLALELTEARGAGGLRQPDSEVTTDPEAVTEAFKQRASEAGVDAESTVLRCRASSAPRKLAVYARNFDISVMRQLNPDNQSSSLDGALAEEILFGSGRPVLYVPFSGANMVPPKNAVIGWDGSRATSRATHDAIPLLQTLDKVLLLVIGKSTHQMTRPLRRAEVMAKHLGRHGVNAEIQFTPIRNNEVGKTLLEFNRDNGIDLLVMGGYGTSHLRQIMFGGVTHSIFKHMNAPVCMSH